MRRLIGALVLLTIVVLAFLNESQRSDQPTGSSASIDPMAEVVAIEELLNRFHQAASEADLETYFGCLTADALFVGTDATEVWSVDEFRAYTEPYFSEGRGWTYTATRRQMSTLTPGSWQFYEALENEKYGSLRGSGAVIETPEGWRISQYVLSFAVPNDATPGLLEAIAALASD